MNDITLWQLATDIGLVLSLGYFCFCFAKSTRSSVPDRSHLSGLEASLRGLVKQAETSSHSLNDKLSERQRSMEQLLFDLETVEHRINGAITTAEGMKKTIQAEVARSPRNQDTHDQIIAAPPQPPSHQAYHTPQAPQRQNVQHTQPQNNEVEAYVPDEYIPEPPSFEADAGAEMRTQGGTTQRRQNIYGKQIEEPQAPLNIYGRPVESTSAIEQTVATSQPDQHNPPLTTHLEKEVDRSLGLDGQVKASMEDIYASAEEMLRAGKNMERVSSETQLPMEEVRMLYQIITQEDTAQRQAATAPSEDARLGVLGGGSIKRHSRVV
ncbi:hypothetical protein OAO01_02560 [Oligoflexia bacterium]|nr:hypothetical protein [Oligoflexia bacterium]